MFRPRLLITESERFAPQAIDLLRSVARVTTADLDRSRLLNEIDGYEAVWVRLRHRIDEEVLARAPNLRVIATATTGLNHIDLSAAQRRGIEVISLRGESEFLRDIRATAEHTIGLMLALLRRLPAAVDHVGHGGWDRDLFCGRELYRQTIGIIGWGRLGRLVARYLTAFDATVIVCDPHIDVAEVPDGIECVDLATLLDRAGIVTVHVDLNPQTERLLGPQEFDQMRRGAWLINTSRGEVLDEAALLAALRSGQLAGAALDVLADEQSSGMSAHPLIGYARKHDQLIITPHIGGCTRESMARTEIFLANKVCAALQASSARV